MNAMRPHAPTLSAFAADRPRLVRGFPLALAVLTLAAGCASTGASTTAPAAPAPTPTATSDATVPETGVALAETAPVAPAFGQVQSAPADPATTPGETGAADATATASADPRTQAELDFAAIYGTEPTYNPVADPTLPEPAQVADSYDPWEPYNRRMHQFNNFVDRAVARPLARAYVAVVPRPVRLGVSNFFNNLGQPVSAVNALLQGKPVEAAQAVGRFAINSTLGIAGIFDPATDATLPRRSEDFGQTLGVWGWEQSRYVELPLFGPRTVRDVFGMVGDAPLSPLRQVGDDVVRIPLQGPQLVDVRTQLLATDSLREGAADDYALVRDAWMQRRDYQIFGDRMDEGEVALPEYLGDDATPILPVGAIPIMPPEG